MPTTMDKEIYNPLLQVIDYTFERSSRDDLQTHYLPRTKGLTKWTCYTDYCFDDKGKPNDTFTITLIPYVQDFEDLTQQIRTMAPADIKNTTTVQEVFMTFLKEYPLINFSFIVNERKKLFGKNHVEVKSFLRQTFKLIREQFTDWGTAQPAQKSQYDKVIQKINRVIRLIDSDKKVHKIVDMVLVTFFSAYVSSRVIKNNNIEIFGWFSDRDALNEVCDSLSTDLFQYYLHCLCGGHDFQFVAAPATSTSNPYYEELVRIPDFIAGALADFNGKDDTVSKDKFNTVLTGYMADNTYNNFIFRLSVNENQITGVRVNVHKKKTV